MACCLDIDEEFILQFVVFMASSSLGPSLCDRPSQHAGAQNASSNLLLTRDRLDVEFDYQSANGNNRCAFGCLACVVLVVIAVCLVIAIDVSPWSAHHSTSTSTNTSDDSASVTVKPSTGDESKTPLIMFGVVVLLLVVFFLGSRCNSHVATVTQQCSITSNHLFFAHGGLWRVEKKIPLANVRSVTIRENGRFHTVVIDTGTYSRDHGHRRGLAPEIILRGVTNAQQVREFIFAKQHALQQASNQRQVSVPIAQAVVMNNHRRSTQEMQVVQLQQRVSQLEAMLANQQGDRRTCTTQYHVMAV